MSFDIETISFKLGEVTIPVGEICAKTGRNYERLIQRSGFEFVHRTTESDETFFKTFIDAELKIKEGDFVIFVNQSISSLIPGKVSRLFSNRSDATMTGFLEISDGCTGFCRGLIMAHALIESGTAYRVHIVCAEKYSDFFSDLDESVSPIFSDAISLTTLKANGPYQIIGSKFRNYFDRSETISIVTNPGGVDKLRMDGAQVLTWATREVPALVNELLEENGLGSCEVNSWLLHQGSKIVVESLLDKLEVDLGSNFNATNQGNTVSSTIPIMLKKKTPDGGEFLPSGFAIMLGFGVGLSIIAVLLAIDSK